MKMMLDPVSGLMLPEEFIDQKVALKKVIDDLLEKTVIDNQHITGTYFLILHFKFDDFDGSNFVISQPVITRDFPDFTSNQMVFYINNGRGLCEMLWMVRRGKDGKLNVEFNKSGVAYLQAKGAMPS